MKEIAELCIHTTGLEDETPETIRKTLLESLDDSPKLIMVKRTGEVVPRAGLVAVLKTGYTLLDNGRVEKYSFAGVKEIYEFRGEEALKDFVDENSRDVLVPV